MRILSVEETQKLDLWAINNVGIPRQVLMENAGKAVANFIVREITDIKAVAVFVYKGNNGGDGLVCARYLHNYGIAVKVYSFCQLSEFKNEPKLNLDILKKLNIPLQEVVTPKDFAVFSKEIKKANVLVDAIFGVGLKGRIMGFPAKAIDLANGTIEKIVAVDVPTGVNANSGIVDPHAIRANYTVTFNNAKTGFFCEPASGFIGRLFIADIGIPLTKAYPRQVYSTTSAELVTKLFKLRDPLSHKGTYGKTVIFAGSQNMLGAAMLCARSALRAGAGLVYLALPESLQEAAAPAMPEVITVPMPETQQGSFSKQALGPALELCKKADVIAIGSGISDDPETIRFVADLLVNIYKKKIKVPIVVDADALLSLVEHKKSLKNIKLQMVITPHPGEASGLLGSKTAVIQKNRERSCLKLAKKYKAVCVLKGAYTVIADPKGNKFINVSGNPGMATAGAGDVLSGVIAGLLAQKMPLFDGAAAGVYIHGIAGDLSRKIRGENGIISSDIVDNIPFVIKELVGHG